MSLREEMDELLSFIDFELDKLSDHPPVEDISETCEYLSLYFRTLAECHILFDGNSDKFYHTLVKSGHIRLYYLKRCLKKNGFKDQYMATSYSGALLDVLAARNFDLAFELSGVSQKTFWQGEEYEDDFSFFLFIMLLIEQKSDDGDLNLLLQRFEDSLEGQESAKLLICHSLFEKDQALFDQSFDLLLDEREQELENDKNRFFVDEIVYHSKRRIYTEGLAILNLADKLDIVTQQEYRYCPLLARLPMKTPFPMQKVINVS